MVDDIQHLPHIGASDHQCLQFNVNYTFNKPKPKQQTRFKYHKADMKKLKVKLDIDWDAELAGKSADEGYTVFLDRYNAQFGSVFTREDTTNIPVMEDLNIQSTRTDININPEMVQKKLGKLRTYKSSGPDGVHPLILKNLSTVLDKPLSTIFNTRLQSGARSCYSYLQKGKEEFSI
jgi:hypothetical protein